MDCSTAWWWMVVSIYAEVRDSLSSSIYQLIPQHRKWSTVTHFDWFKGREDGSYRRICRRSSGVVLFSQKLIVAKRSSRRVADQLSSVPREHGENQSL
ncbi:hypothetical protein BJY04DRAFT_194191 [Aspergillus karnatakaensis]|uniref:uncharacterized protein n=1 Tax=Aspergillus karnatakaensis TaxID=1810916 RepID=UPI003CCCC4B9